MAACEQCGEPSGVYRQAGRAGSGRTWQKGDPRPFCSGRCRTRSWQKDNPERVAAAQTRAKAAAAARRQQLRAAVYTQQGGRCSVCDETFELTDRLELAHRIPVSHPHCHDGDINGTANLQLLHRHCGLSKRACARCGEQSSLRGTRPEIRKRRQTVERMRRNGATTDETAAAVGMSAATVRLDRRWNRNNRKTPGAHVARGDSSIEWYTPSDIVEAARTAMGSIDCDPASCDQAQTIVGAAVYYTAETDGLAQQWRGTVFMNPPYAAPLIGQFVDKLGAELIAGRTVAAVVLTNNATETRWGRRLLSWSRAVCYPSGRIKYLSPDGEKNTPLQGQMLCGIGPQLDPKRFAAAFAAVGVVRP